MPKSLLWAACPIADRTPTTLRISCTEIGLNIVDKTIFGRNATSVPHDGSEVEGRSRGRGRRFLISKVTEAVASPDAHAVRCQLVERGEGWETRQERHVVGDTLYERHVVRPGAGAAEVSAMRCYVRR